MSLPTGAVTFLFTDIEGSTPLFQQHPQAMPAALARHHALLHEAIAAAGGQVFQIIGDAFCAAFAQAADALGAALAGQQALLAEPWGETGPLKVRMGLHTGPAEVVDGEYQSGLTLIQRSASWRPDMAARSCSRRPRPQGWMGLCRRA